MQLCKNTSPTRMPESDSTGSLRNPHNSVLAANDTHSQTLTTLEATGWNRNNASLGWHEFCKTDRFPHYNLPCWQQSLLMYQLVHVYTLALVLLGEAHNLLHPYSCCSRYIKCHIPLAAAFRCYHTHSFMSAIKSHNIQPKLEIHSLLFQLIMRQYSISSEVA